MSCSYKRGHWTGNKRRLQPESSLQFASLYRQLRVSHEKGIFFELENLIEIDPPHELRKNTWIPLPTDGRRSVTHS